MARRTKYDVDRVTNQIIRTTPLPMVLSWSHGKVQLHLVSEDIPDTYERSISPLLSYSDYCLWANGYLVGVMYLVEYLNKGDNDG